MAVDGSKAMIPKARGMYAKRISNAQYEELMRKRTVPEVAALLKKHPYFKNSLATLSTREPHRAQVEELLTIDIFNKFEELVRYDFNDHSFAQYFLVECAVRELMSVIHRLSIGQTGAYMSRLPHDWSSRMELDLSQIANVRTFAQLVESMRFTRYYKVLRKCYELDPNLQNYPLVEAELLRFSYAYTFELAHQCFSGQELASVENLFKYDAEIYNINVIMRIKTYFNKAFPPDAIRKLLMPYTYRMPKRVLNTMIDAKTPLEVAAILSTVKQGKRSKGISSPEEIDAIAGRALNEYARQLLHLTTSPSATLAAFMTLAKQERENVVNVVEGVRYGLPPEQIRKLLKYN